VEWKRLAPSWISACSLRMTIVGGEAKLFPLGAGKDLFGK
jgi:hypothetical protein